MAWPHCGRILRNLRGAACNILPFRDTTTVEEVWKGLTLERSGGDSLNLGDFNGGQEQGTGVLEGGNRPFGHSSGFSRIDDELHKYGGQSFRRTLGFAGDIGFKCLHSSSIESEPPSAARTSGDAASHEGVGWDAGTLLQQRARYCSAPVSTKNLLEIEDGRALYSGLTSKELLVTLCNLQLVSSEHLVNLSLRVLTSRLMKSPATSVPILWLVKRTAYSHFCAGEDLAEAAATLSRMWEIGLKGVLDYSLEDAEDNGTCDQNCAGFLNTIYQTRSLPEGSVSFVCVKISAIYPINLLERMSDHLRWQHLNPEYKPVWNQDNLRVLAQESPTYHTQKTPEALSSDEERDLARAQTRWRQLCEACAEDDLPILVDAEYSSIQPAIDYITHSASFEFNKKSERPIVYGTMQTYLKDAPSRLSVALDEASKRNVSLAVKLVRGAYITRETAKAASLGAQSPVHRSIEDTHNCYNFCASTMLDHVVSKNSAVMFATHNIDSGRSAAQRAYELGLDKGDPRVQFAQLKGMADSLSLALVHAGFTVSKYLPFGPVADVIPYLVRRAEENRGLLGNTLADRRCIRKELGRRLGAAVGL